MEENYSENRERKNAKRKPIYEIALILG